LEIFTLYSMQCSNQGPSWPVSDVTTDVIIRELLYRSSNTNWLEIHTRKLDFDQLFDLVVRVTGYRTEMYCASCEVRTEVDRLCGLVDRVPDCRTEMYCAFCEVRTEFIYVI
jgi:hypothetical protein